MNKHFQDTWYYVKRAAETMGKGVREEFEPLVRRVEKRVGSEDATPAGRLAGFENDLQTARARVAGELTRMLEKARAKLDGYRTA